jgi:D-3-phosphoglycerate dehydrogenase
MSKTILFLDKPHPYLPEQLEAMGYHCQHAYTESAEALSDALAKCTGIILRSRFTLDKAFLANCPQLKFIARMGIGLEHVDLDYAKAQGIQVLNSPEGSRDTVAEQTLGMMLGLLNHINKADREIRQGVWDRKANRSYELRHRTVGIIGYGNIGTAVAQRLSSFGCTVLAYDKYRHNYGGPLAEEVSLQQLQEAADIVTVHIPYSESNHHFVNEALLQGFRKPIFLLNTARGLVLDTAALVRQLEAGKVLGAALDVLEYEEQSFNTLQLDSLPAPFQYLRQADNVILTPHTAGLSREVMSAHARVLVEKIGELEL